MTTKVHIVNFGPDVVEVRSVDSTTQQMTGSTPSLFAQQSVDLYVHSNQSINISERKPQAGEIHIKMETQPVHPQRPAYYPGINEITRMLRELERLKGDTDTQGSTSITVENDAQWLERIRTLLPEGSPIPLFYNINREKVMDLPCFVSAIQRQSHPDAGLYTSDGDLERECRVIAVKVQDGSIDIDLAERITKSFVKLIESRKF
jgi:hypothetical protein